MNTQTLAKMILRELEENGLSPTGYRAARELGITEATFSRWVNGKVTLSEKHIKVVANYLKVDEFSIELIVLAERREKDPSYAKWREIMETYPVKFAVKSAVISVFLISVYASNSVSTFGLFS